MVCFFARPGKKDLIMVDVVEADVTADDQIVDENKMSSAIEDYLTSSKVKSNGVREVPTKAFYEGLETRHGIDKDAALAYQKAIDFETTAAAHVALQDLEGKIADMSKEDLANDATRRGLASTVRLPTYSGSTEVTVRAERSDVIPARGDQPVGSKISHGKVSTSINTKMRVHRDFHTESQTRIRAALGIAD
jgi:hypothetical protein